MKDRAARAAPVLPKGFRDSDAGEIRRRRRIIETIATVYERYGFEPLETPALEFTEALGKFLPDQDRPNAGVFSLQDDDEAWLSLRYDLTAPLARYYAANATTLPKPFRRYQSGEVFRNEKPGPGRFRQFFQFDADTVGSDSPAADAELCMMAADTLEALGIARGAYVVKLASRRMVDGAMDAADIAPATRLGVLRALDKADRLGLEGVAALLGAGRRDESGDFTPGAGLARSQIDAMLAFAAGQSRPSEDLAAIAELVQAAGYGEDRIRIDTSVVRGLEYYTGAVFEAELLGDGARVGSVGGGGRYDDLIARFTGERVPATGFSIGVSRLVAALDSAGGGAATAGPVVVLVMDRARLAEHQALTAELRAAGIRAEMYLGTSGMKAQMKYADRRAAPLVIIEGEDERAAGTVTVKDMAAGAAAAAGIADHDAWRAARPAQESVARGEIVAHVARWLAPSR